MSGGDANDHFRRFIPAEGPSAPPDLKYKPISGFGAGRKPPKREESGSTVESRGRSDSPKVKIKYSRWYFFKRIFMVIGLKIGYFDLILI